MNVFDSPAKEIGQGHLDWILTKKTPNVIFTSQRTIKEENFCVLEKRDSPSDFATPENEVGQGHPDRDLTRKSVTFLGILVL